MKLLIIDDEENMCHMLKAMVERHGYRVTTALDARTALELVKQERFDFILCDIKMPGMDGMAFLREGSGFVRESTIIMMSAYGTVDLALAAMKAGAYDFVAKPFKTDEILLTLKKAEEREQLRRENRRLKDEIAGIVGDDGFGSMVATSSRMKDVFTLAQKVAVYDTTVLVTGESGTGKELVARGIHRRSPRGEMPFVAINCGSLPENLLESELFGYVKGAFTGADKDRKGMFREAEGSTLFLDEIGELPLAMQVKLLRVLQEKEVRPIGAARAAKVDVRIVAATARDLRDQVKAGSFRQDLFYRLNVVQIKLPSLRDRKEDIPLLCAHFIDKYNRKFATRVEGLTEGAKQQMLRYGWPGNVRELENTIQRGIVLATEGRIDLDQLPAIVGRSSFSGPAAESDLPAEASLSLKTAQKQLEARYIRAALDVCGGNKSQAAKLLEISYPSLLSKIKDYALGD